MNQFLKVASTGDLAIPYNELTKIVSLNTANSALMRERFSTNKGWKHEHDEQNKVLIYCETLPSETKSKITEYLWQKAELVIGDVDAALLFFGAGKQNVLNLYYVIEQLTMAAERAATMDDLNWFVAQSIFSPTQSGDLKKAAGWLRILSENDWYKRFGIQGQTRAFMLVAKIIKSHNLYSFKIGNGRKLEEKVRVWRVQGYSCLMVQKTGNQNAIKTVEIVTEHPMTVGKTKQELAEIAEDRMIEIWCSNMGSIGQVHTMYDREAIEFGLPQYTEMRIRQILSKPSNQILIQTAKLGKHEARKNLDVILKRRALDYSDMMWSIDGTTVQLWSISDDGKRLEKKLYIVIVADVKTKAIIGYSLSRRETSASVIRALRSAVDCAGFLPQSIQYDNSSANKSEEVQSLLKDMKTLGLPSEPYNPRSKYSEKVLADFEMYLRMFPSWVGSNVTAKKATSRANPDNIAFQFKNDLIPTEAEVETQVAMCIGIYNMKRDKSNKKETAKIIRYKNLDLEYRTKASRFTVAALFWVKRKDKVTYQQTGIITEIEGVRYNFWVESKPKVESVDFRNEYAGARFWIRYNPECLDCIQLYDDNDKHIAEAVIKYEFNPMPTKGEMEMITENRTANKARVKNAFLELEELKARNKDIGFAEVGPTTAFKDQYNDYVSELEQGNIATYGIGAYTETLPIPTQQSRKTISLFASEAEGGILE